SDDAAGDEERRHAARAALMQRHGGFADPFDAADPRADHHSALELILVALRFPSGVVEGLAGSAHRVGDELVDLALLLGFHPLVGVIGAVRAVAARDRAGDLARHVGDVERFDFARAAFAGEEPPPRWFDAAGERRDHTHSGDDDAPHLKHPVARLCRQWTCRRWEVTSAWLDWGQ